MCSTATVPHTLLKTKKTTCEWNQTDKVQLKKYYKVKVSPEPLLPNLANSTKL